MGIGKLYDPTQVVQLLHLNKRSILSTACSFEEFINLQELNLSGNEITSLHTLNVQRLPYLRVLDVSNNKVDAFLDDVRRLSAWVGLLGWLVSCFRIDCSLGAWLS